MNATKTITRQKQRGMAFSGFALVPETQILFIGAMACTRHRAQELSDLQKQGRLAFLCLDEVDFITGRYLSKIEEAITELVEARHPGGIYLTAGCQAALLSTDWQLLIDKMEAQTGVPIRAHTGCHLCGVQHDAGAEDEDSVDSMVFDMLQKAEPSQEVSVNVLTTGELAADSELRQLLTGAGVERINLLRECKTFAQYQEMARAHLNIICVEDGGEALGQRLQARLGIPYVVLGGVYGAEALERAYQAIGQVLGVTLDTAACRARLEEQLAQAKRACANDTVTVEGSLAVAKWLYEAGLPVTRVTAELSGENQDLQTWFAANAPAVKVEKAVGRQGGYGVGKPGYGGQGHSESGGRPEWAGRNRGEGGGRPEWAGRGHGEGGGRPEWAGRSRGEGGGRPEWAGRGHGEGGGRPGHGGHGGQWGTPSVQCGYTVSAGLLRQLTDDNGGLYR
ncbi:MAG: nitrogenase component 1 [Clostridiales bacterium]|nr:nitrogenase component 1 [Clostridiales bacterium]